MQTSELALLMEKMGCPPDKAPGLARQLDKRARQLSAQQNRSYEDALAHLLKLMQQGWAAQQQTSRP